VRITAGPTGTDLAAGPLTPATATWDADTSQWVVNVQAWVMGLDGVLQNRVFTGATEWRFGELAGDAFITLFWLPYYQVDVSDGYLGSLVWAPTGTPWYAVTAVSGNEAENWEVGIDVVLGAPQLPDIRLGFLWLYTDHTSAWMWPDDALSTGSIRRPFVPGMLACPRPEIAYAIAGTDGVLSDIEGYGSLAIPAGTDSDVYWYGSKGTSPHELKLTSPGAGEWGFLAYHIKTTALGRLVAMTASRQSYWWYVGPDNNPTTGGWSGTFVIAPYTYTVLNGLIIART